MPFYNASGVTDEHHGPSAGSLSLMRFGVFFPSVGHVFFTDAHKVTTTRLVTVRLEFWTIKSCMLQSGFFLLFCFFKE